MPDPACADGMGRMSDTDAPSPSAGHRTWWRAPLVASVLALPLVVLAHWLGPGPFRGALHCAVGLLVLAWVLPRRRSLRALRITAGVAAIGCALAPLAFLLLLGLAWGAWD
jgi:Flp pilus assembly protein TadB